MWRKKCSPRLESSNVHSNSIPMCESQAINESLICKSLRPYRVVSPFFFYSNYDWILIIQLPTRAAHRQTYSGVRERAHYSDAEKTAHVHARSQKERQ